MPISPVRQTANLRKGRQSLPGARYFLTCCLIRPASRLIAPEVSQVVRESILRLEKDGDWKILAATMMPDHLHILFHLGESLSLDRVVAKFKALSKPANLEWQSNYYEHRLKPDESESAFARYIFMNPYRARLLPRDQIWPHWIMRRENPVFDFVPLLKDGQYPPSEWMSEDEGIDWGVLGND